jgi:uroporphyrinogen decarboxylase
MNGLERLIAAGRGEPTDCVPVAPGVGHYAAFQAHQPMTIVAYDPELMAGVVLAALERHGYDSCSPITDYGIGTESMGSTPIIRDWEQTFVADFPVKARSDMVRLRLPDPLRDGRMPVVIGCEQILVEQVGARVGVNGGLAGPLSFAANLRGPQQILYDVVEDAALVHELLRIATEAGKSFGEAQVTRGHVSTMNIYEPLSALISPAMADEFSFPYLTELIAHLKGLGATVLLHICYDTTRLIERMFGSGAAILCVDVQVDLAHAKEIARGRVAFSGNVATQHLAWLSAEEIYAESCRVIERAAAGGRFTLSSSCEVPIETPAANIDAMVRAAREFGSAFLNGAAARDPAHRADTQSL